MYYNDEVKQKYLATLKSKHQIASFFGTSKPYEDDLQLDVGAMPDDKTLEIYQSTNPVNVMSVKSQLPGINSYRRWYREHFDDWDRNQAAILTYEQVDISRSMGKVLVKSWDEIMSELRAINYDFYQGYETAPLLALLWLGFGIRESVLLKRDQIDWNNGLIFDAKHVLKVRNMESEIVDIFRSYQETTEATRTRNHIEKVYMSESSYFIHRMDSANNKKPVDEPRDVTGMSRLIRLASEDYEVKTGSKSKMIAQNVLYSGQLHRLHEYLRSNPDRKDMDVQTDMKRIMGNLQLSIKDIEYMHKKYQVAFGLYYGDNDQP